jgi:quinol monooxygenase YgiN
MGKMALIARMTAAPGKRNELVEALGGLVKGVEDEPGTLVYVLNTDDADENVVWFYELYADQDALAAHSTSDTMKTVGRELAALMAGRPELHRMTPRAGKGVDVS